MKLNNQHRESFVDSVIKAIPVKNQQERSKTIAAIEDLIWSLVPDDIKEIKKREPQAISTNSLWCFKVARLKEGLRPLEYHPHHDYLNAYGVKVTANSTLPALKVELILADYKAYMEEQIERNQLWETLYAKAQGATTLAALKAMFPDFVEHMPPEEKKAVVVYKADEATTKLIKKAGYPARKGKK